MQEANPDRRQQARERETQVVTESGNGAGGKKEGKIMSQPAVVRKASPIEHEEREALAGYSTQDLYRELLLRFDEDPTRNGLEKTPERVEKAMTFLTRGYHENPTTILRGALFDVDYDEMVIVKDVEMFSLCEHHMLPFFGRVHVAYIPKGKVIGLEQDSAAGGRFRAATPGAGAHDAADRALDRGCDRASGRRRGH